MRLSEYILAAVPADTLSAWTRKLTSLAQGLQLSDAEDRATFRLRVSDAAKNARVSLLQELARELGATPKDSSRHAAERAVADAWIARHH